MAKSQRMKSYSNDLRRKIVAAYETGDYSQDEMAELFGVCQKTVSNFVRRNDQTGSPDKLPRGGGRQARLDEPARQFIRDLRKASNHLTMIRLMLKRLARNKPYPGQQELFKQPLTFQKLRDKPEKAFRIIAQDAMTTRGNSLEANQFLSQRIDDLLLLTDRRDRIGFPAYDQGWAPHAPQLGAQIESDSLTLRALEKRQHFVSDDASFDRFRIRATARIQGSAHASILVKGGGSSLIEDSAHSFPSLKPSELLEGLEHATAPHGVAGPAKRSAHQNQFRGVIRVANCIRHRHVAAKRRSQYDGALYAEHFTEFVYVVGPSFQRPVFGGAQVAPPMTSLIQVDNLRHVAKRRESRPERRMIQARPAVQQKQRRFLSHYRPGADQLRPFDVEEEPNPAYVDKHI